MLSLVEHQQYLRVMDIKETDIFQADRINLNFPRFYNQVILGQNDLNDNFKHINSLSKLILIYYSIFLK